MSCPIFIPSRRSWRHQQAFTLVEVLIAMTITVVLLGIIWRSVDTYRQLQQKAETRTAKLKVLRGLSASLRDDLAAIQLAGAPSVEYSTIATTPLESGTIFAPEQDSPPRVPSEKSAQEKRGSLLSGLRGGSTWMVIDVAVPRIPMATIPSSPLTAGNASLHAPALPRSPSPTPSLSSSGRQPNSDSVATDATGDLVSTSTESPTRWQRIAYFFVAATDNSMPQMSLTSGLTRMVTDPAHCFLIDPFVETVEPLGSVTLEETPAPEQEEIRQPLASSFDHVSAGDPSGTGMIDVRSTWRRNTPTSDVETEEVPEIVYCRFRYFDGESWQDQWDSGKRQALPLSIAFSFVLQADLELATNGPPIEESLDSVPVDSAAGSAGSSMITDPTGDLRVTLPSLRADRDTADRDSIESAEATDGLIERRTLVEVPVRQFVVSVASVGRRSHEATPQTSQTNGFSRRNGFLGE